MPFYAVKVGRNPGVYEQWGECQKQIAGFSNAFHKSFKNKEDAQKFLEEDSPHALQNVETTEKNVKNTENQVVKDQREEVKIAKETSQNSDLGLDKSNTEVEVDSEENSNQNEQSGGNPSGNLLQLMPFRFV